MVGGNSGPATSVSLSPIVEALCSKLEATHHTAQKIDGQTVSRWRLILTDYHHIRELVMLDNTITKDTNLQLYELNQTTLMNWYDIQYIYFYSWKEIILKQ